MSEARMKGESSDQEPDLDRLVELLGSRDGLARERARNALVAKGRPAIASLIPLLADSRTIVRWEAAKALASLPDRRAAHPLTRLLKDEDFDVRWVAAEALVALGEGAVEPVLTALIADSGSIWLRRGSHHVLKGIRGKQTKELIAGVLKALDDSTGSSIATLSAAEEAEYALQELRRKSEERKEIAS